MRSLGRRSEGSRLKHSRAVKDPRRGEDGRSAPKVGRHHETCDLGWSVQIKRSKEKLPNPCCNLWTSGNEREAMWECCNKVEGINSPLSRHCKGPNFSGIIVQLRLCNCSNLFFTFGFPFGSRLLFGDRKLDPNRCAHPCS